MWCAFAACQLLVTPYEFQNSGYHSEPGLSAVGMLSIALCGWTFLTEATNAQGNSADSDST